jgi:hypothetical protein
LNCLRRVPTGRQFLDLIQPGRAEIGIDRNRALVVAAPQAVTASLLEVENTCASGARVLAVKFIASRTPPVTAVEETILCRGESSTSTAKRSER